MIVVFEKEYLLNLYEAGKCDKKYRFQPDVIKRYVRCINYLKQAKGIEELYLLPSLHYKVLKGDKRGISSIRVNIQYRLEFIVDERNEPKITICNVLELSNHYE